MVKIIWWGWFCPNPIHNETSPSPTHVTSENSGNLFSPLYVYANLNEAMDTQLLTFLFQNRNGCLYEVSLIMGHKSTYLLMTQTYMQP